jgi:hypothetical protein
MKTLKKIENYMNRDDAHGFSVQNKTTIMDVIVHITGNCDVTIYNNGKFTKQFSMHRKDIMTEVKKHFDDNNRPHCVYLFG